MLLWIIVAVLGRPVQRDFSYAPVKPQYQATGMPKAFSPYKTDTTTFGSTAPVKPQYQATGMPKAFSPYKTDTTTFGSTGHVKPQYETLKPIMTAQKKADTTTYLPKTVDHMFMESYKPEESHYTQYPSKDYATMETKYPAPKKTLIKHTGAPHAYHFVEPTKKTRSPATMETKYPATKKTMIKHTAAPQAYHYVEPTKRTGSPVMPRAPQKIRQEMPLTGTEGLDYPTGAPKPVDYTHTYKPEMGSAAPEEQYTTASLPTYYTHSDMPSTDYPMHTETYMPEEYHYTQNPSNDYDHSMHTETYMPMPEEYHYPQYPSYDYDDSMHTKNYMLEYDPYTQYPSKDYETMDYDYNSYPMEYNNDPYHMDNQMPDAYRYPAYPYVDPTDNMQHYLMDPYMTAPYGNVDPMHNMPYPHMDHDMQPHYGNVHNHNMEPHHMTHPRGTFDMYESDSGKIVLEPESNDYSHMDLNDYGYADYEDNYYPEETHYDGSYDDNKDYGYDDEHYDNENEHYEHSESEEHDDTPECLRDCLSSSIDVDFEDSSSMCEWWDVEGPNHNIDSCFNDCSPGIVHYVTKDMENMCAEEPVEEVDPLACIMDCPIENLDPHSAESFCPWFVAERKNQCFHDCTDEFLNMAQEHAEFTCGEWKQDEMRFTNFYINEPMADLVDEMNRDSHAQCPAGYIKNENRCEVCPAATYSVAATFECIQCKDELTSFPGSTSEEECFERTELLHVESDDDSSYGSVEHSDMSSGPRDSYSGEENSDMSSGPRESYSNDNNGDSR